jgi:hypothetical protein
MQRLRYSCVGTKVARLALLMIGPGKSLLFCLVLLGRVELLVSHSGSTTSLLMMLSSLLAVLVLRRPSVALSCRKFTFDSPPPLKPYNGFVASFNCFLSKPIWSKAERNRILTLLSLSIRSLVTSHLSMCVMMTMASICGKDTRFMSASVKVRGIWDHLVRVTGPSTATWLTWR